MSKTNGKPIVACPKDESFEAYRDWIKGLWKGLTGREWNNGVVSDEELREDWEKRKKRKEERLS